MKIARVAELSGWLLVQLAGIGGTWAAEFQVNQHTLNEQNAPTISHDSSGGFVVAWRSPQDGSYDGIFARRFDSSGGALGPEFLVNEYTTSGQVEPAISHNSSGGFVVVWESNGQDGSFDGIFARRFDNSGAPAGGEFQVNQYTLDNQDDAAISHDSSGGFVVAWESRYQDGSDDGIFARRFDSSGTPVGGEFQVNEYTTSNQRNPAISHDSTGRFVVAWQSSGQDGSFQGVFGRRFDSVGDPLGPEFQVNEYTTDDQSEPAIAHNSSGGFAVAWESVGQDGAFDGVFGRRFDSSRGALGGEFQVNQSTTDDQDGPTISGDSFGGFVVAWESRYQDGSYDGIFARRFDSSGSALGPEFQVNQYTTSEQRQPMISHDPSGGFAVAWGSYTQDGSSYGVFARRFPRPTVVLDDDVVIEGQAGSTSATFLIQLSEPPDPDPLELNYSTADGTAVAGSDYTSSSGMLSIPPGQTLGFVTAPVLGDTLYEADEFFLMNLSSSGMANIPDPTAVGAIFNDDDPPSLAIGDVQIVEGNSGTSMAEFTVSISEASGLPAQVDFSTFNGTASAGKDYTAASGTLIFPAMSTAAQTASVSIDGDLQFEPDETFFVQLSQPADATIGDDLGIGTILNDDGNFLITTGPAAGGGGLIRRYEGD